MRALRIAVAVALLAVAVVAAGDEPAGEVLVLDDKNFDAIVPNHDVLLVEFYAPWCGHCKALAPKYDEAAKLLAANHETKDIRVAKFDADSEKSVPGRYGISGFPTIKLFRNGEVAGDYDGEREANAIVEFMKKKAATSVNREVQSGSELKQIAKSATKPTLIAVCSSKDHVDYKYYKAVVSKMADTGLEVYHSAAPSALEEFGFYSSGCSIQLFRPTEGAKKANKVTYKGTVFKDKLREWIVVNALAPFTKYTPDTQKLFNLVGKNVIRVVRAADAPALDMKGLNELAKEQGDAFLFATSDAADYQADVDTHCGKGVKTCVLLNEVKKNRVFAMEGTEATPAAIKQFIEDFNGKKLKVKVKSEPTPPTNKAGEVGVVVGSTFESEVMDNDKDIFIEFYAPWCGHCKALVPKYEELAKETAADFDTLSIVKFDLTNNDLPGEYKNVFEVSGFPTIFFVPKGKKTSPIKYEGDREAAAMKKWIDEHRK
jgi:protein disulfide isomerase